MKRLIVSERKDEIYLMDLFDGKTFDEAVRALTETGQFWHQQYPDAVELKLDVDWAGHDNGVQMHLMISRWETDRELEARKTRTAKEKQARQERKRKAEENARAVLLATEAQEKALFEQLRAKYGEAK